MLSKKHERTASRLICALSAFVLLSSCSQTKQLAKMQSRCNELFPAKENVKIVTHDSIIHTVDTLYVPYQELVFADASPCPPQVVYHKEVKKGGITSSVTIKDGVITQKCVADSLQKVIDIYKETVTRMSETNTVETKQVEITHWYEPIYKYGFWIYTLLFVGFFAAKLVKIKTPWG